jgi:hypothetical protein
MELLVVGLVVLNGLTFFFMGVADRSKDLRGVASFRRVVGGVADICWYLALLKLGGLAGAGLLAGWEGGTLRSFTSSKTERLVSRSISCLLLGLGDLRVGVLFIGGNGNAWDEGPSLAL